MSEQDAVPDLSPPARVVWIEIKSTKKVLTTVMSPPARVVWIEIRDNGYMGTILQRSPPARVVWIEIERASAVAQWAAGRHPRGWCGLK